MPQRTRASPARAKPFSRRAFGRLASMRILSALKLNPIALLLPHSCRVLAMWHILLIASIVSSVMLTVLQGHAQSRLTAPLAANASPLRSTSSQNEPTPPIRPAVAAELLIEDVPLPGDVSVSNPQDVAENLRRFSGAWVGVWGGQLRHILVVENVMAGGSANVVYAVGDNPAANVRRQWDRHKATISGNTPRRGRFATYELPVNGKLDATYQAGNGRARATMSRIELADLTRPGAIAWGLPNIEFLDTALKENGKPIRLETVLVKPSGSGPFPSAVFNHGSTGTALTHLALQERFRGEWACRFL